MRSRSARPLRGLAFFTLLIACGSRTALFTEDTPGEISIDASIDVTIDVRTDASIDVVPPLDVQPPTDVNRNDCPDADSTYIYVVSDTTELYSFYPPDQTLRLVGNLVCPLQDPSATPFSMAVDRKGKAYVVYRDGELFNVSTLTAACTSVQGYTPNQQGFLNFGMGFATIGAGPDEALYLAKDPNLGSGAGTRDLGRLAIPGFSLARIGAFNPQIAGAELTGTGDGRLFAFYSKQNSIGSFIGEINTSTAAVIGEKALPTVDQGGGWAFGFWGGDFYTFTSPDQATSTVTRYRPADDSVTEVASLPRIIVGAGVSTCAPQQ